MAAILAAARRLQDASATRPTGAAISRAGRPGEVRAMSEAVGKPLQRIDGRQKVTGEARYAGDVRRPRVAQAVVVQSTIARGRIVSIGKAAALAAPGVVAVLTHENAAKLRLDPKTSDHLGEKLMPLSGATVHFAGQHIALVVAETLEQAEHAASLLAVRYEEEPPVLTLAQAAPSATAPEQAMGEEDVQHRRGDVESALAAPDVVKVEATYVTPVETNNPMEPSATLAWWEGERLTVEDSTQAVVATRDVLAGAFGLPRQNVRVLCRFTGGGFGCKGHQWPHTLLAALAAKAVRRPVRLVLTRAQMFTSVGHRPPTVQRLALAARRDGKLAAIRHETTNPTSPLTDFVAPCGAVTSRSLYACENVATPNRLVRVNVGAPTPMRAPAECPASFALESAMDELAYALGMDPLELRRRNHADRDPAKGRPWSSKHLEECYARGAERFGWRRRSPAPRSMKNGDLLVGWGMATAYYPGKRRPSSARVRLLSDGSQGSSVRAVVQAATQELGTGSYTVFTQVSADALGLPVERVAFELGDSDLPEAPFSAGSCSVASVSEAILAAAAALKGELARLAGPGSPLAGLAPGELALAGGRLIAAAGSSRGIELPELLRRAGRREVVGEASARPAEPKRQTSTIQSFGAQFCEVEIDPLLARVRVTRFVSVIDAGRILNPRTSRSQVAGAIVMGIGAALLEETVYDPRTGRPVNDNLADYLVPVQADVPEIEVELLDHPDPDINSLGCRGVGEIGITGVSAAIANAVFHATGRRVRELPITPDKLL